MNKTSEQKATVALKNLTPQQRKAGLISFLGDLRALGYGTDQPIDGSETVDTINKHWQKLTALEKPTETQPTRPADYTEEEEKQIGEAIARLFQLKKIRTGDQRGRYRTAWGTKTALGLARTFRGIAADLDTGNLEKGLLKM